MPPRFTLTGEFQIRWYLIADAFRLASLFGAPIAMAIGRFSRLAPRAPRQSRYVTVFTNRGTKAICCGYKIMPEGITFAISNSLSESILLQIDQYLIDLICNPG
ncbi:hypothetical protein DESC_610285 [Desulfosarcina cetonica]|nr:hypothetical protein DESC_610285 [Desulfosarcina cetonica]